MSERQWQQDEIDEMLEDSGFDEDDDEWPFDCSMDRNGQCGKAGSEECDFECPIMLDIHRREAEKRAKKKRLKL